MTASMDRLLEGETFSLYGLYESTPQPAGLTLTIAQCYELQALGIPWPISGDKTRTSPVIRQTLTLRPPKHDQDPPEDDDAATIPELLDEAGPTERKAAKSLGIGIGVLMTACSALWSQTLSAERDARAGTDGTKQARGYVTRELLDELKAHLSIDATAA